MNGKIGQSVTLDPSDVGAATSDLVATLITRAGHAAATPARIQQLLAAVASAAQQGGHYLFMPAARKWRGTCRRPQRHQYSDPPRPFSKPP